MKHVFNLLILVILITAGMSSCQKDLVEKPEAFDIGEYTGRYEFDIEERTFRDGVLTTTNHKSIGYVTEENPYMIKVLFDFAAPKVNCVYEYVVKPDGSFYSTYRGAGDRTGQFDGGTVVFDELIDLGGGNYKHLDFLGISTID